MRINKFRLEKAAITTYQDTDFVGDIQFSTDKVEYYKTSTLNESYLTKKGNFQEWDFFKYRSDETDLDWELTVAGMANYNGLANVTFTPDTVDNPSDNIQVYFWSKEDLVNDYDVEKIKIKVIRMYSEGNEP